MKLRFEYIDEETGRVFALKNKGERVFYHDSEIHDSREYEDITGRVMNFTKEQQELVNAFYNLAGSLI